MSITIEARLKPDYLGLISDVGPVLTDWVTANYDSLSKGQTIDGSDIIGNLADRIDRLDVSDTSEANSSNGVQVSTAKIRVHAYKYSKSQPTKVKIPLGSEGDGDSGCCPTVLMHELPSQCFKETWDQLYFEPDIKPMLLKFVRSLYCVSWNRIILLYGSPGSGKTTLCRALAQKIAMRSFPRFNRTVLLEVNTRTLLSRWFSESSRLVDALFDWILEQAMSAENQFFCIMIDEVESIASSRKAAAAANEPADAIRVVNSLLTALDRFKTCRNILVLATSNLLDVIDEAFLDRVDLIQHVNIPSVPATYNILLSCIQELIRCEIILYHDESSSLYDHKMAGIFRAVRPELPSSKLLAIAERAQGLSGRALRRIPLLLHASVVEDESMDLSDALEAMLLVVEREQEMASGSKAVPL